jgi:hypothetical protein
MHFYVWVFFFLKKKKLIQNKWFWKSEVNAMWWSEIRPIWYDALHFLFWKRVYVLIFIILIYQWKKKVICLVWKYWKILRPKIKCSLCIYEKILGVSIIDPIRFEPDLIRHDPKINGSGMSLIFLNRIESGSGQRDPTRLIIFFEVILWFSIN